MADNTNQVLGPVTVWTLAAGSNQTLDGPATTDNTFFHWNWAWIKEPMLIPRMLIQRPGSMGSGSFAMLRDQRQEPGSKSLRNFASPLVSGKYVCVTGDDASAGLAANNGLLTPDNILWYGWISALNYSQVHGTTDGIGTASALEVGHLLDQQQVTGWKQVGPDSGYGQSISSPPTANMANAAGYVIGNAKLTLDGNGVATGPQIGRGGQVGYAFARLPEDCGTAASNLWTRWRLLRHLVYACWPTSLPPITIICADNSQADDPSGVNQIAGFLNDTSCPEVYDLRNLTLKGALDMCIPQARGFGWTLELVDMVGWQLTIFSYAPLGGTVGSPKTTQGVPANLTAGYSDQGAGVNVSADKLVTDIRVVSESTTLPDEIRIEGAPIVFAATIGFADGNLKEGWKRGAGNMEDVFRIAASGDPGYGALTYAAQLERNAMVRNSSGVRDVYTRYGLYAYANADINVITGAPGTGSGGSAPLCPQVDWDGASLSVADKPASRCPYLPAAALLRTIPWPEGVRADGTDLRPAVNKYLPVFMRPKIFRNDTADTVFPWVDFESRNGRSNYPGMSLDVDDTGAAFRLTLPQPEYMAYRHWTDAAGGTTNPAVSEISPDATRNTIDYTTLVATVAVESDQRVLVKIIRPGLSTDDQVRNRLVIRDPALQCYMVPVGTILGLKNDGTPDRVTGTVSLPFVLSGSYVQTRNDWPSAQRRANQVAAWAFHPRSAIAIERADPTTVPAYGQIGYLITKLIEAPQTALEPPQGKAAVSIAVNSIVEEVMFDFGPRPRITISTTIPALPGFPPLPVGSGGGPTGGGSVSISMGGTVAQAVQTLQQAQADNTRDTQRVPIIVPRSPPVKDIYQVAIIGGNVLSSGQQGIKSASVTSVPSHYDPATDTSMVDGVGYGTLIVNGVSTGTKVLVVNNGSGTTYNAFPLIVNDVILSSGTVSILVGAGPDSVTCYTVG